MHDESVKGDEMKAHEAKIYIVSACLLGENCKYSGGNNLVPGLEQWLSDNKICYIAVCPEVAGGLPTPREPMEICNGRVIGKSGEDYTENMNAGAYLSIKNIEKILAEKHANSFVERVNIDLSAKVAAILKSKSPSCGFGKIYDGSFTGRLTEGNGIFADILSERGVCIYNEKICKEWL